MKLTRSIANGYDGRRQTLQSNARNGSKALGGSGRGFWLAADGIHADACAEIRER